MTLFHEDQAFERMVQKIAPQSRLLRTWSLKGGISAEMTAFELQRPDGEMQRMIVRRPGEGALTHNPQAATDEYKLLQITQSLGLATQTPYHLDLSGEIFPTPYLVIEYIEGEPEFAPSQRTDFLLQSATHLAGIHRVEGSHPALSFLPQQTSGLTEASIDTDPSFDTARLREVLTPLWPPPERNASVLLHGDYWPGNLLWREGNLVAVIDWEDAKRGDPLIDLAISRLDMLCLFGSDSMNAFTHHYRSQMAIDYSSLPHWDLYAALRLARMAGPDLAEWVAFFPPFGRRDITEQTMRDHYQYFVSQALENLATFP
jgi:aminoglycoside phosphotransferase (APT) family kinase protein